MPAPPTHPAPLFLLGAPRSGTTLLYKAICLHPRAAYISNWVRLARGAPPAAALDRLPGRLPGLRRKVWFGGPGASNAYVYGRPRSVLERAFPMPVEGEPFFRSAGLHPLPGDDTPPGAARALAEQVSSLLRWSGGDVFVSKRISHNWRVPLLAEAFPEARFVHLVRDGRAVAASLLKVDWWMDDVLWWSGCSPRQWMAEGGDEPTLAAEVWVRELEAIEQGLAGLPPGRVLTIHFEQLIRAPEETLISVAEHAGIDSRNAGWRDALGTLSFPSVEKSWAAALDGSIRTIEGIQSAALDRYGYERSSGA